ncbi:hypothetical protein BpHYR1_034489 [Brachionus plicatilis]|uniref:Transcription factor IIIC putative zinc-finger domain-containing protein n=1 Tax=Brachionus plicatilis TaxID=10195 RepID=A0A3M7RPI2_BRAPC|nr:hypothetical protein BpHYR1_034489 [Brachionus plicatilis]
MDDVQFKNLDIELLNNLKYTNYGQVREPNSIDMSLSNRLAICTDKCVVLLNQNFEWPSQLNNSSPFKFFLNQKLQNDKNKQQIQIDEWIQDLNESKNETLSISVIRSVPKSDKFLNIFQKFQDLSEYRNFKNKSFQKQLQFMSKRSNANEIEPLGKNLLEPSAPTLREQNSEEFSIHKALLDQSRLLDLDFYQFLSFLNPYSSGAAQENDLQNAFKFCKWNLNPKISLLFTLTEYNQMIIFDCTQFTSTTNSFKEQKNSDSIKIFDFKSNSKLLDLTDFFITNCKSGLKSKHTFNNIEDFMACLGEIIPKAVAWGPQVYTKNGLQYEILLIGFKSNQIAIFYIYPNLNVELFKLIDLPDFELSGDECDEMVDTSMDGKCLAGISDVKLGHNGVLAVALSDGRVLAKKMSDSKFETMDTHLIGIVKKLNFDHIDEQNFVLIAQAEYEVGFFFIDHNLEVKSECIYKIDEEKYSAHSEQPVKNYLTKGLFKLVDNGLIDLVQLSVTDSKLSAKNSVLNTNININFGPVGFANQDTFKTSKQIFFSKNQLVLYQINDFGKSSLIQKRPANFEINVYRMKNLTFMKENFDVIYENFKNYRTKMIDRKERLIYLKRIRILAYLLRNYFEVVANFDSYNAKIGADVEESSEESDYRDEDELDAESRLSIRKEDENSMVKSVSFYELVFRETSLLIFRYYCVDLIRQAYGKDFNCLEVYEKALIVQMDVKDLEEWAKRIRENFNDKDLLKLCDLCGKKFSIDGNLNLNKIKCISGHNMNRCEKSLMPLNNFRYKKCSMCNSKWNYVEMENGLTKNFEDDPTWDLICIRQM